MGQILAISSQVIFGPVGNTAAVPALQAASHSVMQVPTIILSAHPGHSTPIVQRISNEVFAAWLKELQTSDRCKNLTAIMTGYFSTPEQVIAASQLLKTLKKENPTLYVLVDPVMGDEEGLYVSEQIALVIKQNLLPLATCITPNRFELEWLSGQPVANSDHVAGCSLNVPEILATSIPAGETKLLTIMKTTEHQSIVISTKQMSVPHGTGDFLSGLYLACRLQNYAAPLALEHAMAALKLSIAASLGLPALDLEPGLRAMRALTTNPVKGTPS